MNLSTLSILLGLVAAVPAGYGLARPESLKSWARRFPRHVGAGYVLTGAATIWFLFNLQAENIADFEAYKRMLLLGFAGLGVGTCIYLRDFLAVRGLAVLLLLLAKLMVDTARWEESDWRLVIVGWAYLIGFLGMWLTLSPWRMRDWIEWFTRDDRRFKIGMALRAVFGGLLVILGLAVF